MKSTLLLGVLAYHGDVIEHVSTLKKALKNLNISGNIIEVRTKNDIQNLDGLVIPGGESTVIHKLSKRAGIFEDLKAIPCILGTCAGAILLAKIVEHKAPGQETLERMNITVDRNAYGRQTDSFEERIVSKIGEMDAVFIRAPKIKKVEENVTVLAKLGADIIACEEEVGKQYFLALCFHPELTTTFFHEHFIKHVAKKVKN